MFKLFKKVGIDPPMGFDPKAKPGQQWRVMFTKELLSKIEHPAIQLALHIRSLSSLRAKFLLPYASDLRLSGMLRYSLHQLPVDDEGGTVSGRFSSSGYDIDPPEGSNIQQVAGKKQLASVKSDAELAGYIIRELFVPESGLWLSADAEQIEYRFFAHYAKPPAVIEAYRRDPRTDFHRIVMEMVKTVLPTITRERTKDINFALIYGAGLKKIAAMLGLSTGETKILLDGYHSRFPEARRLLTSASMLAENRGYVKTMMGRRARFSKDDFRTYSALNRVIQGSAADENKLKLVALHKERKSTGFKMRFTVHDEVNGDVPDLESARRVREILNTQILPTCVPLLWKVCTGPNWKNQTEVTSA
jgi:DNA polymerase I-like protein with 3'-5' exonuclease and polymerase domains